MCYVMQLSWPSTEWMGKETLDHWRATTWRTTTPKRETYLMILGWTNSGTRYVCAQRKDTKYIFEMMPLSPLFFSCVSAEPLLLVDGNPPRLLDKIKSQTSNQLKRNCHPISHKKDQVHQMFYKVTRFWGYSCKNSHLATPIVFECSF